ncbi:hypothetical protein CHUAL_001194 [Chamberlinius hualienensis]
MESLSNTVKIHVPNYLSSLPIPNSVGQIFKTSAKEWLRLLPLIGTVSFISWVTFTRFFPRNKHAVNPNFQKESDKVVHCFDIEDLGAKVSLCRCWRSQKFPYCDGTHNEYNTKTGDNVGPVVIKK